MKTIQEFHDEALDSVQKSIAQLEQEIISSILLASESSQSKRAMLGYNKKHHTAELPLFTEKKLF